MDYEKISEVIAETLSKDFENIKIVQVDVAKDLDRDGDVILRINVVFEGDRANLGAINIASPVRRLRPAFKDMGEIPFPLLAFIASNEYGATGA